MFFPRSLCIPWRLAKAKIPSLTYKDIILYGHAHTCTESLLSCCVLVSEFALDSLLSRFLLKLSTLPSDPLLLGDKGDRKRQESLFPQAPGARDIKRGERERGRVEERRTVAMTPVDYSLCSH